MIVDEGRHECDGESVGTLSEDLCNLLVFEPNDILPIHFSQVMVNQNTIPASTKWEGKSSQVPVLLQNHNGIHEASTLQRF